MRNCTVHELLIESPSLLLDEIGEWFAIYHDQPISMMALHNNLKDLGLTYKCLKRIPVERDDAFHAEWLHNMTSNYTADQIVLLDESSDDNHTILHRYSRAISGQDAWENCSLNKGVWYSVLPVLTLMNTWQSEQLKVP
jgi:hypothetical protein